MWLTKNVGGSAITGPDGTVYAWPGDGQEPVEVPEDLGAELLQLKGYQAVAAPDAGDSGEDQGEADGAADDPPPPGDDTTTPPKAAARSGTTRSRAKTTGAAAPSE